MSAGFARILLYIVVVLVPLLLAGLYKPLTDNGFLYEVGRGFALVSFMVLNLQPLLAARLKFIERPFGLDMVIRHHKYMAVCATLLLICHPLLLSTGKKGFSIVIGTDVPWPVWLGRTAIAVLLVSMFFNFFSLRGRIRFEVWRAIHDVLGPLLLVLIFSHSFLQGGDLKSKQLELLWILMCGTALSVFAYHRLVRPRLLRRHAYTVMEVRQETRDVWTVKVAPPEGMRTFCYLPGQFQFITFFRDKELPVEEHHWTISSSPTERRYVSSTIKELGDFTFTIGKTKPGDTAVVHAPFGRFSYILHPDERDLVFIAGGIGITPLMSMLRHMRDTRSENHVLLLYANKTEEDIVFRRELIEIETGAHPRLKTVHVLSKAAENWQGETGYIDGGKIKRLCGNLTKKAYYLCGPETFVDSVITFLKSEGVRDSSMHREIFSFVK